MKDQLYLLRPGFMNAGMGPLYCSDSAPVEGVLSFFPQLRDLLDIHYLEFPRPRTPLVRALGEQNQSLPVLILAPNRKLKNQELEPSHVKDQWFFTDQSSIRHYLSTQYDLPQASE
ncbi:MAG: hypothetical protein JWN43_4117 [Gammaproteobacteria bacterium]|nr:hypothetical protein [Gammaproteobacteria bacterium]